MTNKEIAKQFGVGKEAIFGIKMNRTWKYLGLSGRSYEPRAKLSIEQVKQIFYLTKQKIADTKIAPLFGVTNEVIRKIRLGKSHVGVTQNL